MVPQVYARPPEGCSVGRMNSATEVVRPGTRRRAQVFLDGPRDERPSRRCRERDRRGDDTVQVKLWSSSSGLCAPTVRGMPLTQIKTEWNGVEKLEFLGIVGIGIIVVFIAAIGGAGKPSRRRRRGGSWLSGDGGGFGCGGGSSCGGGGGD